MPRMLITDSDYIRVKALRYLFVKEFHLRHQISVIKVTKTCQNRIVSNITPKFMLPKHESYVHFAENGSISKTLLKISSSRIEYQNCNQVSVMAAAAVSTHVRFASIFNFLTEISSPRKIGGLTPT